MNKYYGPHLTIDAKTKNNFLLGDLKTIYKILDELPGVIGMKKIIPPYVVQYCDENKKEDWGLSGFVMIAESHISIHTYPDKNYFFMDIFSCRPFEQKKAIDYVFGVFQIDNCKTNLVERGTDFPR